VRRAGGRNADVVVDPQEPHGHEMDTPVVIECGQVRYELHRKELVDLGGTEDGGFDCGGVRRAACHNPPLVFDLPNGRKIKNGGIYQTSIYLFMVSLRFTLSSKSRGLQTLQ